MIAPTIQPITKPVLSQIQEVQGTIQSAVIGLFRAAAHWQVDNFSKQQYCGSFGERDCPLER